MSHSYFARTGWSWFDKLPTKPGYYWVKRRYSPELMPHFEDRYQGAEIIEVFEWDTLHDEELVVYSMDEAYEEMWGNEPIAKWAEHGALWSGPLEEPSA